MSRAALLCLLLLLGLLGSCQQLVGTPRLRSGLAWRDEFLHSPSAGAPRRIWIRLRGSEARWRRPLQQHLQRMLREEGWQLMEQQRQASVWLDLELRFVGENPLRDEGESAWLHVLHAREGDLQTAVEPAGGLPSAGAAMLQVLRGRPREYAAVLDLLLLDRQQDAGAGRANRTSLLAWVARAELGEVEAMQALAEVLREGLRRSFARPQLPSP